MAERMAEVNRRHVYVTPSSYLELLRLYSTLLNEQRELVTASLDRYTNGLVKLQTTKTQVRCPPNAFTAPRSSPR
jgi:dynein heavy chain